MDNGHKPVPDRDKDKGIRLQRPAAHDKHRLPDIEDLAARLSAIIAASPAADIEKNARALLSSFFSKLDLVSREEFDIQAQVLLRTREKLKALETRLDALEHPAEK